MALLICGTLVVALPPISDQMYNQAIIELKTKVPGEPAYLGERMSAEYRAACYLLGAGMILTSMVASVLVRSRSKRAPEPTVPHDFRNSETVIMSKGSEVMSQGQ